MKVFYGILGVLGILCGVGYWTGLLTPTALSCGCYAAAWGFATLSYIFRKD